MPSSIAASPLFNPLFGFGGNGLHVPGYNGPHGNDTDVPGWTGGGCITDGPFASYNLSIGPGTHNTNHCLTRAFNPFSLPYLRSEKIASTLTQETYELFRIDLEGLPIAPTLGVHDAGHLAVGGEMYEVFSSPGDPIFYLHHANIDRIWWIWQSKDLKKRLKDISGRTTIPPPHSNVTLDYELEMDILAPTVRIRDVMDIRTKPLCYTYE
ncbi:hypothetical protein ONZ45_g3148 [Pleurotus djamor]|nr:hypothetical protein ONZ45_g3148 [Pleurotus djamor]